MASDKVKETSDSNFTKDVIKNSKPVLVDFWAEWCAPCKALSPLIDEIAQENAGKIEVYKVNIDNNPQTPSQYGVRGIPTVIAFKNGQILDQTIGSVPKTELQRLIDKLNT
ncbi:MAG: thioredoxin [Deltaproteobacteria bacterium RIFCSPLOWO2_02_FULL_50_16]|nr:MAG: thioredoxin [Deltaproteobacteria bacterium GWA2_50_8]OGQ25714.1 MAG: thioredoxin [Deltaproteobacteria bacterium RIFCSPHIGHO2_02_FULL_50_15]OGQ56977.1 MAG: thioredoxin [Deltaproteobacteria bacterium RIFCSPLOWO2_02_FULL_50_16]OGQ68055.1 MAG: thioredoxin [Deltaproteobacteria bacterium RIFCSPLOWO2_12_FULL_50_11]